MNKPKRLRTLDDTIADEIRQDTFTREEFEQSLAATRHELEAQTAAYEAAQLRKQTREAA